jgi:hypothetical protein
MRKPVELTIPETLDPVHAALLREHHFETAGHVGFVMRGFAYDGMRVLYAITDPAYTRVVYVGDSEVGRNLKGRLKDHLDSRKMAGHIERESLVFVHVMVTEYMVLDRFEEETGSMPLLNVAKAPKNAGGRRYKVNGRAAMEAAEAKRSSEPKKKRATGRTTKANPKKSTRKPRSVKVRLLD